MADGTPDPAASALDGLLDHIRDGAESEITHPDGECGIEAGGFCTPHAALVLLAAVEAALSRHVQAVIEDGAPPVFPFRYCSTCSGHPAWPCPEVTAITAALAGKEGDDGRVSP